MQRNAQRDGCVSLAACYRAKFLATRPCVFCWLKVMKIVIVIQQITQEKFASRVYVLC